MVIRTKKLRFYRKVVFMPKENPQTASPSERLEVLLSNNTNTEQHNIEDANSDVFEEAQEDITAVDEELLFSSDYKMQRSNDPPLVPNLFTSSPVLRDILQTNSSNEQDLTVQECLPLLAGCEDPQKSVLDFNAHGVPSLDRKAHIAFLHGSLKDLPAGFVAVDASRPWMLYWALTGLYLLGEDISPYRERCVFPNLRNVPGICFLLQPLGKNYLDKLITRQSEQGNGEVKFKQAS
ncbi:hypothetical protein GP486_002672 [Trichoglossum hirsutum]|uniref:Prenyltransferase alpha-alpha toroid domain-containing protein n=1 Tax=Trichoglossum hirsutum TaxID=265104 RepID=A0A9P8LEH9_9PEZI|nr:hypothetical protein GP486_002672 [Trichoglossum hirsutum]